MKIMDANGMAALAIGESQPVNSVSGNRKYGMAAQHHQTSSAAKRRIMPQ
jgi:hypothetical protein